MELSGKQQEQEEAPAAAAEEEEQQEEDDDVPMLSSQDMTLPRCGQRARASQHAATSL